MLASTTRCGFDCRSRQCGGDGEWFMNDWLSTGLAMGMHSGRPRDNGGWDHPATQRNLATSCDMLALLA